MFVRLNAWDASCWTPSPVRVEKLSTVPLSLMSWITCWEACCFRKLKFFPYSCWTFFIIVNAQWLKTTWVKGECEDVLHNIPGSEEWPSQVVWYVHLSCSEDRLKFCSEYMPGYNAQVTSSSEEDQRHKAECTDSEGENKVSSRYQYKHWPDKWPDHALSEYHRRPVRLKTLLC